MSALPRRAPPAAPRHPVPRPHTRRLICVTHPLADLTCVTSLACRRCGNPFTDTRAGRPSGAKPSYCSDECRLLAKRATARERQRLRRQEPGMVDAERAYSRAYRSRRSAERRRLGLCIYCPDTDLRDSAPGISYCLEHAATQAAWRNRRRLAAYGLTEQAYADIYSRQRGLCAICENPESASSRGFHVDHDHSCCPADSACGRCVRGLLCGRCNSGIGLLGDSADRLQAAAKYLVTAARTTEIGLGG